MISKTRVLSAIAGLAMLATPVSALAGHRHDDGRFARFNAWHERGMRNGLAERSLVAPEYSRSYVQPPLRYGRWGRPLPWNNGFHRACDADGDDCRVVPNRSYYPNQSYSCDADGDDCHPTNGWRNGYWNNGGYYGAYPEEDYSWYQASPPASYGLAQQRDWLIARRHRAMLVLARMRARGDRRGADRMVPIVRALNNRISTLNYRLGGGYARGAAYPYAPVNYAPNAGYSYAPRTSYAAPLSSLLNPYGSATTPYYPQSGSYYGNSPLLGNLGSLVGPMLGLP